MQCIANPPIQRPSTATISPDGAAAPYYLIATLSFASRAAVQAALASPEGAKTVGDLANFATGGVDVFIADTGNV